MNKIYKVIWSKTRNCYVAVSEIARNHGKDSVRSEKRGLVTGTSALALCIALSLGVTGSVWADDPTEMGDTVVKGNLSITTVTNDDNTKTGGNLTVADGAIVLGADGSIKAGSLDLGTTGTITAGSITTTGSITAGTITATSINLSSANFGTGNTVGNNSLAVGENNTASGTDSIAVGSANTASGNYSFAGGGNKTRKIVIVEEYDNKPNVYGIETVTSDKSTESSGNNSFAYGYEAKAVGDHSFAFGSGVTAGAVDTTQLIGLYGTKPVIQPVINGYAVAFGLNTTASGQGSVAVGSNSIAYGNYSFAGGSNTTRVVEGSGYSNYPYRMVVQSSSDVYTTALGYNSFAYGYDAHALSDGSVAFGYGVTAGAADSFEGVNNSNNYSVTDKDGNVTTDSDGNVVKGRVGKPFINGYAAAFGYKTTASGEGSLAAGKETTASGKGAVATGIETKASGAGSMAAGYKTEAGFGSYAIRQVESWQENVETGYWEPVYVANPRMFNNDYASAFGENTTAAGKGSIAFGQGYDFSQIAHSDVSWNEFEDFPYNNPDINREYRPISGRTGAYGDYSATFGSGTYAQGENAVAMGSYTNALGKNSLAYGFQSFALGKDATAFGNNTWAAGHRATAFGSQTEANNQDSLAFGLKTVADGKRSTAFGSSTWAYGHKSTAFGTFATAQSENSTAFGEYTQASGKNALAFGHYSTTGVRYQSEQDKKDGVYTMTSVKESGWSPHDDSSDGRQYSPSWNYSTVKAVKIEDKQFAQVLTDDIGNVVKTEDGHIVYHAHKGSKDTYAVRIRQYDSSGEPYGDYLLQEVKFDETTGKYIAEGEPVSTAGEVHPLGTLTLTDLDTDEDYDYQEKFKKQLYRYVMDETAAPAKNAVAFGNDTNAQAPNSLAFGDATIAGGKRSTAFGNHTVATGDSATAFGDNALASARNATAFGESSRATQQNATTFGQENAALAKNATAWGHKTKATGEASNAYGDKSLAAGKYATSFGEKSVAFAQDSVSWGSKAVAGISIKDDDYKEYIRRIDELTSVEEDLKTARKEGDIAETARLTDVIAVYEGDVTDFYNRHFLTDQKTVDKLNQATLDSLKQAKLDQLNSDIKKNALEGAAQRYMSSSYDDLDQWAKQYVEERYLAGYMSENNITYYETLPEGEKITDLDNPITVTDKVIGKNATAWGNTTNAIGLASTAWGKETVAEGENSTAWGNKTIAKGKNSTAFGDQTQATGVASTAWGNKAVAEGKNSTAFGNQSIAVGGDSTAFGNQSIAVGGDSTAFGKSSKAWGDNSLAALGGTTGKGSETEDGYTVDTNAVGAVAIGVGAQAQKSYTYAVGNKAKATADNTLAIGNGANATKAAAIAIGTNAMASGEQSISVGYGNQVKGKNSGAFGDPTYIDADSAYAIGNNNTIETASTNSFVVGNNVTTTATNTVVVGNHTKNNTHTFGENSVSLGFDAVAQVNDSVALGSYSVASIGLSTGGYNVLTGARDYVDTANTNPWRSTHGAVSVGTADGTVTRQITGVAAGTRDTDAVNVAQLKVLEGKINAEGYSGGEGGGDGVHYYSVPEAQNKHEENYNNDGAKGQYAMAAGVNTIATKVKATALGYNSLAAGDNSVATGFQAHATGDNSTAYGVDTKANGSNSVAVGLKAYADSDSSSAIGIEATAVGNGGLAIGHGSSTGVEVDIIPPEDEANGLYTTKVHTDQSGNPDANGAIGGIAIGSYAHTEGTRALAVGRVASAYGENSTAMGLRSSAYGEGSMAFGHGVVAGNEKDKYAKQKEALHNDPTINYDLDGQDNIGVESTNVIGAVAIGSYAKATGRGSLSVGRYSEANSAYSTTLGIRASVLNSAENAIAIGREAEVGALKAERDYAGLNSIAIGTMANVKGQNSIAIGMADMLNDDGNGIVPEQDRKPTTVTGDNAIAIGMNDTVEGSNSIAIGKQSTITGDDSIAVGTGHTITGSNSGAFGDPNVVNADASYIIGNNSKIDGKDTETGIDSGAVKDSFILGNDSNVNKSFGVALGSKTTVSAEGGVALGSESVASRNKGNGGAGAGFDVTTGKSYAGKGSDSATWTSTLAAVSVGGDSKDGSIGAAAKATRQITGVAAGTADTDAVNVAQLKLAMGAKNYTEGANVHIDENNVINAQDTTYQFNTVNGEPDTNVVTTTTVNSSTDGKNYDTKVGEFMDTDTKITNVTVNAGKKDNTGNTPYTITLNDNGDNKAGASKLTATFNVQDTTYTTNQSVEAGTDWKDGKGGSTTFTITDSSGNNLKPMTVKAGDNVKITKGANGEAVIHGNGLTGDTFKVEYDDKGVGSVTIKDEAGKTATITNIRSDGGEGVADSINYLGDRINKLDNKIDKVGAGAAALAGLHPLDFDPDEKWDFAASVGSYKSEQAVALGAFYRPNEDTMFSIGGTIGNGNNMVNVGVSWKFGQKNRISANRISSAKEIIELRKNQEDVHSFLADAVAGNQLDLSKIQLFPDVEENHWAYDYVATMAGNGVLEGYPDGYFKGNRNMTRYEMAAVLYRLMQNGARLSDRALTEFAPELDRIRVDTITHHKDGTPHIQRVRTIKERVDEKADPSSEKAGKKKAKVKVAEKPVE